MSKGPTNLRVESLDQLCSYWDRAFIERAYWALLGRAPDKEGGSHHLAELRSGVSKLTILLRLRESAEGRQADSQISGLDEALARHRATMRSGPFVRWLTRREGDAHGQRVRRAITNHLAALEEMANAQSGSGDSRALPATGALTDFSHRAEVGIVDHLLLRMVRVEASLKRIEDQLKTGRAPAGAEGSRARRQ